MYQLDVEDETFSLIVKTIKNETTLQAKLWDLISNPLGVAIPTNNETIGDYYINCGNKYSLLFNIDDSNETVELLGVIYSGLLWRILTGRN